MKEQQALFDFFFDNQLSFGIENALKKIKDNITDIQNSTMVFRMQQLGDLGHAIGHLIFSLKMRRTENNYTKVASIIIDIIKKMDDFKNYPKNEETKV